jgi:hypothetical protein
MAAIFAELPLVRRPGEFIPNSVGGLQPGVGLAAGRIIDLPVDASKPVDTFWDL